MVGNGGGRAVLAAPGPVTVRTSETDDTSNLKISKARKAAQAALAIKPTEMVALARISCIGRG
jgi:hypothetical protein